MATAPLIAAGQLHSPGRASAGRRHWRNADRLQEPSRAGRGAAMVFRSTGASGLSAHQRGRGHKRRSGATHLGRNAVWIVELTLELVFAFGW